MSTSISRPLVSVIMPTYNSERFVHDAIQSVLRQTMPDLELLVSDDSSTDTTNEIIQRWCKLDSRITLLRAQQNEGAALTRNRALAAASGRYIAFLDSDDLWLPEKLAQQLTFMEKMDASFTFTAYQPIDVTGTPIGRPIDLTCPPTVGYKDMLSKKATLGCSTVILRRDTFGSIRMPLLRTGQDYALWLRLLRSGHVAYRLPVPLTHYRLVPGSISRNKTRKAIRQWQIYRDLERLPFSARVWHFINYAYRAVFRA